MSHVICKNVRYIHINVYKQINTNCLSVISATEGDMMKIINWGTSKASCSLHPIPTKQLTEHYLPEVIPVISDIVNSSLASDIFHSPPNMALVKPLLIKQSLHPEICKRFVPVSNLSFISKIWWDRCLHPNCPTSPW